MIANLFFVMAVISTLVLGTLSLLDNYNNQPNIKLKVALFISFIFVAVSQIFANLGY